MFGDDKTKEILDAYLAGDRERASVLYLRLWSSSPGVGEKLSDEERRDELLGFFLPAQMWQEIMQRESKPPKPEKIKHDVESRIAVYAARQERGEDLFSPDDEFLP